MWNLQYDTNELIYETDSLTSIRQGPTEAYPDGKENLGTMNPSSGPAAAPGQPPFPNIITLLTFVKIISFFESGHTS